MVTNELDSAASNVTSDIDALEKFYSLTEPAIDRREQTMIASGRCPKCWHHKASACICNALFPLKFSRKVRFLVYLHHMEYFNAGDDGKLLKSAAPDECELLVCGRRADDNALLAEARDGNCVLLFPSEDASSVEDLSSKGLCLPAIEDADALPLRVVVLDGTWNRVKSMKRHLARLGCNIPHVRLMPESLDYWVRRGTKSIYARTQSQPDRICTVEATALLLRELGENEDNCDTLINFVETNNRRLRGELILSDVTNAPESIIAHRCYKGQCRSCRARAAKAARGELSTKQSDDKHEPPHQDVFASKPQARFAAWCTCCVTRS